MTDKYTCAMCGVTYEKGRSDADPNQEALHNFGIESAEARGDFVAVCEDCYWKLPIH